MTSQTADKALLLRVGAEDSSGKVHGPLFEDNRFEYIPIPEDDDTRESRTYSDIDARTGGPLSAFAPDLSNVHPHFDPEFETYTYGDVSNAPKRSQLCKLTENDLLIFYCSLQAEDIEANPRLYAMGYFTVDSVYDLEEMSVSERKETLERFSENAHAKRESLTPTNRYRDNFPVIVKGKPERSRLFEDPKPLGTSDRQVLPWVSDIIGFNGDLTRAGSARKLDTDNLSQIEEWLERGSDVLVDDEANLRAYVMTTDEGFAPNPHHGYCTLATCKPRIREEANKGDWILGTPSVNDRPERMVYLMRVEETLSFDEYYHDERFEIKKPENDPRGDNIYYEEDGVLVQDENANYHLGPEHRETDLSADRVLISQTYWYFGERYVAVPEKLRNRVIHKYDSSNRRLYSKQDTDTLRELVRWCSLRFDTGRHATNTGNLAQSNSDC